MILEKDSPRADFSWTWVGISLVVFVSLQVVLGGFAGRYVLGHYLGPHLLSFLEALLSLGSYFLGGMLIGLVSPRSHRIEPAVGAMGAVVATLGVAFFLPLSLFRFEFATLVLGGLVAFLMALAGESAGQRLSLRSRL